MFSVCIIIAILFAICLIPIPYPLTSKLKSKSGGGIFDIQHTTAIKGMAILLILVGHISGTFSTVVFTPLASAGVSLFLIMSGYGLSESFKTNGLSHYWQKKITRVLIPYAIVVTILAIANRSFNLTNYLLNITGISTSYWYIAYQIKWYIVFYLAIALLPKYKMPLMIIASVAMFFLLGSLAREQSFAFVIGVFLSDHKDYIAKLSHKKMLWIFIVAFCIATIFLGIKQVPAVRTLSGTLYYSFIQLVQNLSFACSIISFMILVPAITRSSFLVFCGIISYEIYLLHFPFYGKVDGSIALAFVLIILSVIASYLFYIFNNSISRYISNKSH